MLNVFYRDSHLQGRMSGPLKVIENLLKSLDDCGVEYAVNEEVVWKYDKAKESTKKKLKTDKAKA